MVTQPELSIRRRRGWTVEIGRGIIGKEEPLLSLRAADQIFVVPTKGHSRLSFRARGSRSDVGGQVPRESLTEEEARARHPDCELVHVFSIVDPDGERGPAIFIWQREVDTDKEEPIALYWRATT